MSDLDVALATVRDRIASTSVKVSESRTRRRH
jgi:hypothetical protein